MVYSFCRATELLHHTFVVSCKYSKHSKEVYVGKCGNLCLYPRFRGGYDGTIGWGQPGLHSNILKKLENKSILGLSLMNSRDQLAVIILILRCHYCWDEADGRLHQCDKARWTDWIYSLQPHRSAFALTHFSVTLLISSTIYTGWYSTAKCSKFFWTVQFQETSTGWQGCYFLQSSCLGSLLTSYLIFSPMHTFSFP